MDINSSLQAAISEVENFGDDKKLNIKGKLYTQVKDRNRVFRRHFGAKLEVITEYEFTDMQTVVCRTTCKDKDKILAVGLAEAKRNSNSDKVLEKTQTVSLGRMLACLGLDGGEFSSGDELAAFITPDPSPQTDIKNSVEKNKEMNQEKTNNFDHLKENVGDNMEVINNIRNKLVKAKHLGDLKQVFSDHKNIIENNRELLNFFNNRRNGINNDFG
tara:strand:+ start:392 stop:1039 length:648 start_codon:yes stop_codon:yes gene_type:complete